MTYRINLTADPSFTSLQGYVTTSFARLVEKFGAPNGPECSGDGKVSTEWVFEGLKPGDVFTLYDYKETCAYDPSYPTVEAFRARDSYEWHVGGKTDRDTGAFIVWLKAQLLGD
jgi:hypothetical protein